MPANRRRAIGPVVEDAKKRTRHTIQTILNRMRTDAGRNATRWGIIGLGAMAEQFANALDCVHDAEITAVASRDIAKAQRFAKRHSAPHAYGSYLDMVQDARIELDVIYIATPVRCHYRDIKMCLELGKNVICEKPITLTAAEFEELTHLAVEKEVFLMEGMWMKCLPTYVKGIEWIDQGTIGEVQFIQVDLSKDILEMLSDGSKNSTGDEGVLLDYGVYALAFAFGFAGNSYRIESAYSHRNARNIDRHWVITLDVCGVRAFITISSEIEGDRRAVIVGEQGRIEWHRQFNRTNIIERFNQVGHSEEVFKTKYIYDGFEHQIHEVHRCLRQKQQESSRITWGSTLATLQLIDELRRIEASPQAAT